MTENNFNKLLNKSLSEQRLPYSSSAEESWVKLRNRIQAEEGGTKIYTLPTGWKNTLRIAIAAVILAAIAFGGYLYLNTEEVNTVQTYYAHNSVILPDGSKAELNAQSNLTYSPESWLEERKLTLKGEAFFEVMRGSNFEVSTSQGSVLVKGTAFNVYSRVDSFSVSCLEGEVLVRSNGSKVTLFPGEIASLQNDILKKNQTPEYQLPLWRKDIYRFNNSKIGNVLSVIQQQFGVELNSAAIPDSLRYTGQFSGESLTEALELVCVPLGLNYSLSEDQTEVTITSSKRGS